LLVRIVLLLSSGRRRLRFAGAALGLLRVILRLLRLLLWLRCCCRIGVLLLLELRGGCLSLGVRLGSGSCFFVRIHLCFVLLAVAFLLERLARTGLDALAIPRSDRNLHCHRVRSWLLLHLTGVT
jgi:hypothetical protein